MGHKAMVGISAFFTALCPLISKETNIGLPMVFAATMCGLVWLQEIWIIQKIFREENVDFTRRFYERYPKSGSTLFVGFVPHILSLFLVVFIWLHIGEMPTTSGWLMSLLIFFTLNRVFDPLLGCLNTFGSIPWTGMLAYFAVFIFATTSAIDPSKFDYLPVSSGISEALVLVLLTVVIINLRMAYYERFCFLRLHRLEGQLKLVLIPLLILSITQIIGIVQGLDLASSLNG